MTLYIISCFVLIMFVLLQPGKSDAAQVFGGGGNSSAFGPRGTQTVLAKITITAAIVFFLIAFLFSIPGLFEQRSLGEGVGPAEAPAAAPVTPGATDEQSTPAPGGQPGATEVKPAEQAPSQAAPAPAPQSPRQDDKKPQ